MSEKFRLDRKIRFQNTFYTKCINVIIDSIGPSIILRSIFHILCDMVIPCSKLNNSNLIKDRNIIFAAFKRYINIH